jgi:hypothetical protein
MSMARFGHPAPGWAPWSSIRAARTLLLSFFSTRLHLRLGPIVALPLIVGWIFAIIWSDD